VDLYESKVIVADNTKLQVKGSGKVNIPIFVNGETRLIVAEDVLYVPNLSVNLLSVRKITQKGFTINFDESVCKITNGDNLVATAKPVNDIYKLSQPSNVTYACKIDTSSNKWHRRLGHLNRSSMKFLRDKHAQGLNFDDPSEQPCEVCVKGKQARLPFYTDVKKERRTSKPLQLVHTDICGPMETTSIGGSKYFILFIDDYSRKLSIYFLKYKNEALDTFKIYKAYMEKQTGHRILAIRSDNGREFINEDFRKFLQKEGIKHQSTVPYSPQQNGLAERSNRTVVEKARCLLIDANLSKEFWAEACSTAVYLINRSPAKSLQYKTPHEMWSKEKPDLKHLRIFGCKALAHIPKELRQKWDEKSKDCLFLGYLEHSKGYLKVGMLFSLKISLRTSRVTLSYMELSLKPSRSQWGLNPKAQMKVSKALMRQKNWIAMMTDRKVHLKKKTMM